MKTAREESEPRTATSDLYTKRTYRTVTEVKGPLIILQNVEGVSFNELVNIETPDGEKRKGTVLEVGRGKAIVQVFEGTTGLDTKNTTARFTGETLKIRSQQTSSEEYSTAQANPSTTAHQSSPKTCGT